MDFDTLGEWSYYRNEKEDKIKSDVVAEAERIIDSGNRKAHIPQRRERKMLPFLVGMSVGFSVAIIISLTVNFLI